MHEVNAKQVVERQKLVEKFINYAELIVRERGTILSHEVHSAHIYTKAELRDFEGFSFLTEGSYTMFGGDCVKIWSINELVFEVEWWDIKKCNVKTFEPDQGWQRELKRLIANKSRIDARLAREDVRKKTRANEKVAQEDAQFKLQEEAARLCLN